jgi:uncharacterized membrane protein/thiol-disulfide isomerase/thioredoxin
MDNCLMVCRRLLESLRVPFTQKFLKEKILTHPQYPSLLAITDTLEEYGLDLAAVKLGADRLDDFPLPGIVQVNLAGGSHFNTVTAVSEDRVSLFDEKGEKKVLSRLDFLKIWTGVSLLAEVGKDFPEPEIRQKNRDWQIFKGILLVFAVASLLRLGLSLVAGWNYWPDQSDSVIFLLYFLVKLTGLVVAGALLWYQNDRGNPTLQKFCSGGKRADCNEVLDSRAFQLLEGRINPSLIAFAYFLAGIGTLVDLPSSITWLAGLSLATLPVVGYSFYYQARVIKKWCKFCLLIQGVLVLEVLTVLGGTFGSSRLELQSIVFFMLLFTGVIIGGALIKPLLGQEDKIYQTKRDLAKLKSNKELFEAALFRSRRIVNKTEGLGILLKGKISKYQVIKVCNPYCGPCARVHPVLENLFDRGNIDLQILFTPGTGDDVKNKAIRHLIAIDGKGDHEYTRIALDDWYNDGKKNYKAFASRYPMNGELSQQERKLEAMRGWCEKEKITHTPTLFVNGYELPSEYGVEDLKYLLD